MKKVNVSSLNMMPVIYSTTQMPEVSTDRYMVRNYRKYRQPHLRNSSKNKR